MPTSQPPSYDDTPINVTTAAGGGPFTQYLSAPQYQNYLSNYGQASSTGIQPWEGSTKAPGAIAHYLTSFIAGARQANQQAQLKQLQQESIDEAGLNNRIQGAIQRGVDEDDLKPLIDQLHQAKVGWHVNDPNNDQSLASQGKSNPIMKAMHTIATSLIGEQPGTRSVNTAGPDGKSKKEQEVYTRWQDSPQAKAAVDQLDQLPTKQQKYSAIMQGTPGQGPAQPGMPPPAGTQGFMEKWADGVKDVQNKLHYPANKIPAQEEMQLHAPGLVAEDMGYASKYNMPSMLSKLQPNVPRTEQGDLRNDIVNRSEPAAPFVSSGPPPPGMAPNPAAPYASAPPPATMTPGNSDPSSNPIFNKNLFLPQAPATSAPAQ